jgi:hypothetical protein
MAVYLRDRNNDPERSGIYFDVDKIPVSCSDFKFYNFILKTVDSEILHQLMHTFFKRSIRIYIKTTPTCFGVNTILRERTI